MRRVLFTGLCIAAAVLVGVYNLLGGNRFVADAILAREAGNSAT